MNIRKARKSLARGGRVASVKLDDGAHRPGTAAAKAAAVFVKNWKPYMKGDLPRKELIARTVKATKISPATASTYLHNFAAAQ